MTIAITGTSGFIGSALTAYYINKGHLVVRVPQAYHLAPMHLQQYFEKYPPALVIHCAAYGNHYHHKFGIDVLNANYLSTFHLLNACVAAGSKFIYLSSSSALLSYVTLYSATKRAAEGLITAFVNHRDVHAMTVRPATVTGPGEQPHRLIPTLIRSCIDGESMDFVNEPSHDYVDIDDVVEAIALVADKGLKGCDYNIGTGRAVKNYQVLQLVEALTGNSANITRSVERMREYDTDHWVAYSPALAGLGWQPRYTLRQSIERMIQQYHQSKIPQ